MPPKNKFTKEDIVKASFDITRESGIEAVTARAVAERLCASPKPIFSFFNNMDELKEQVIITAQGLYQKYLKKEIFSGKYPPYKASGMGYIRFAREEKQLFRLLFMHAGSAKKNENSDEIDYVIEMIQNSAGLSREEAERFHLEMWVFVHGIAAMLTTSYLDLRESDISSMLTDIYEGLKARYLSKE